MKKGITFVLTLIGGIALGASVVSVMLGKQIGQKEKKIDKFKFYYNILNQWMSLKQENKSVADYMIKAGYNTIAIYGMGELGSRFYNELKDSNVVIKYAIDKDVANTYSELVIKDLDDDLENVDAIVVTPIFAFEQIKEDLSSRTNSPILSLEDIIYNV